MLVAAAVSHADELRDVDVELPPAWLLAAAPFTFVGGVLLPLAWRHSLGAYGAELPRATAVRVWSISQASRFVPGNVALVASRVLLSAREGVARSLAGDVARPRGAADRRLGRVLRRRGSRRRGLPGPLRLLLAARHAGRARRACRRVLRLAGRLLPRFPALSPDAMRVRHLYEAIGLYGLNNLVRATGFVFVAAAMHTRARAATCGWSSAPSTSARAARHGRHHPGRPRRAARACSPPCWPTASAPATRAAFAVAFRAWDFLFELLWIGHRPGVGAPHPTGSEVVHVAPADVP